MKSVLFTDGTFAIVWNGDNADNAGASNGILIQFFLSTFIQRDDFSIVNDNQQAGKYFTLIYEIIFFFSQNNILISQFSNESFIVIWRDTNSNGNYFKTYGTTGTVLKAATAITLDQAK